MATNPLDEPISRKEAILALTAALSVAFPAARLTGGLRAVAKRLHSGITDEDLEDFLPLSVEISSTRRMNAATTAAAATAPRAAVTAAAADASAPLARSDVDGLLRLVFIALVGHVMGDQQGEPLAQGQAEEAGNAAAVADAGQGAGAGVKAVAGGKAAAKAARKRDAAAMAGMAAATANAAAAGPEDRVVAAQAAAEWDRLPEASRGSFAATMQPVVQALKSQQQQLARTLGSKEILHLLEAMKTPAATSDPETGTEAGAGARQAGGAGGSGGGEPEAGRAKKGKKPRREAAAVAGEELQEEGLDQRGASVLELLTSRPPTKLRSSPSSKR